MKTDRIQGIITKPTKALEIHDIKPRLKTEPSKLPMSEASVFQRSTFPTPSYSNNPATFYKPTVTLVDELIKRLKIEI